MSVRAHASPRFTQSCLHLFSSLLTCSPSWDDKVYAETIFVCCSHVRAIYIDHVTLLNKHFQSVT
eukprot:2975425-Amphidinium_carterae.1